jgi:hypothetical protein
MGIGKDKLTYDSTDANSIAASDTIGAYILSPITVSLDGVYDAGSNTDPDNAGMIVHVRGATPADADQTKRTTGAAASSDAVVAANVHGLDVNSFAMAYNGTTWDRVTSTSGSVNVNVTGSSGTATVSDSALANTAIKSTATGATTTAAVVVGTSLANRKYLTLQNLGASAVYFGDTTVTSSTGLRLSTGAMLEGLRIGPAIAPKVLTAAGTADCRIMELS